MNHLQDVINSALMYHSLMPLDCCIVICDVEGTIIKLVPARSFDMGVKEGYKIAPKGSLEYCLKTGQEKQTIFTKDLFGVPAKSLAVPIFGEGQLVGAISTITTLENQRLLHDSAETIAATTQEITATTEELAAAAMHLIQDLDGLTKEGEHVIRQIQKTDDILKLVSSVAANSNLLGLNAAIEAARAGEHGRGFAVVAEEIRKMADHSADSVKDIKAILLSIQKDTLEIVNRIGKTAQVGAHQGAAAEEISAAMQQLAMTAANLEKLAEIV